MGIRFILMVNKQGQTRLAQYYEYLTLEERRALEGEIVRKCLARNEQQCSFVEHRTYKIVYRRYASLFFLVGVDNGEVSDLFLIMEWFFTRILKCHASKDIAFECNLCITSELFELRTANSIWL
ncbi:hypothetical protein PVL29_014127 [Vitis rotundifolia]|uniref:AP complex mu/sigma subunit domain-containing protein n=1 Tax=Vitis rotundifolia TaxID=103349 RepID=A0AA38ZG84_VITRO|nr:hypothetical protein PVL29_014127 [Vitis rotundifolia]